MSTLADRTIAALRVEHDRLAALVPDLTDDQLTGPSGAAEWSVADVLSHLGSGAEITAAGLRAAVESTPPPAGDFNQGVWDRWNATAPREQARGFLDRDAELVAAFEALDDSQRAGLEFTIGFAPVPLSVASFAGLRLGESLQHSWDVRVALDPHAAITEASAAVLLEQFAGGLGFLLGFIGKPTAAARVVLDIDGSGYRLVVDDAISITDATGDVTATFTGPIEAVIRLIGGRLTPERIPAGIEITGTTLDELRRVFPGY
jgi:uncharacterized protein (TIGR03083 family)